MSKLMMFLPPSKDKCQICAIKHDADMPHDATSLFYLVKFKMDNNKEATWEDAMSHCTEGIKKQWREALLAHGIDSKSINVRGKR